ncbi:MAG: hypothetical protein HY880_08925, partial [Deltaproteobacteria bacterium]|nr:hypothetical protein [Deltaproteobacteria bacterium]
GYSVEKTKKSKGPGNKFKSVGGVRRFILHWKNMTGIPEYKRDISVISTVLEAVHLYWNAIKWQLDHKKAQCAYTNVVGFEDSPQGRIAYSLWKSLTDDERKTTGLTGTLTPGSTVFLLPGMNFEVKAPQLAKLEGENQDLMNVAGSGMKSPQDLFQGQASGSTYASLRASRSPLEVEIKNTQNKTQNFLLYEFLRACFFVPGQIGKFAIKFKKDDIVGFVNGMPVFEQIDVEPIELIEITFPEISFEEKLEGKAGAYLGSKHAGLRVLGISDKKIAEKMGVGDLARQRALRALEEKAYGVKVSVLNEQQPSVAGGGKTTPGASDGAPNNMSQENIQQGGNQ